MLHSGAGHRYLWGAVVLWEGDESCTDWLHQDPEIVWIPRKAWPHWSAWRTALNPGSSRAESQNQSLWEPIWCVRTEQLFQTWQTCPQLALSIEEGHNSACHILNCNHHIPGEKKAEISHSLQSNLGHWVVKSARARKGAGKRVSICCRHSCRDMEGVVPVFGD